MRNYSLSFTFIQSRYVMNTINISCPNCNSTNRIPSNRLSDAPKCGQCKEALFQGKVVELTATNIASTLNHNDIPVLVDCWAPWCGPCRSFAPTFELAAQHEEPEIRFAKLNTEQEQEAAGRWNIRSIPTLILFKGGKEVNRVSGALSSKQLAQWISDNCSPIAE